MTLSFVAHLVFWAVVSVAIMALVEQTKPCMKKYQVVLYGIAWPIIFAIIGIILTLAYVAVALAPARRKRRGVHRHDGIRRARNRRRGNRLN